MAHVAAYCVANDVTARCYHRREVVRPRFDIMVSEQG
jgi:2-keto-4-pentenoate hydratase/2-oxohepta-3-ene-1,7-dioic acid hydratase in catechol pathway